uniref:G-protein coupled receptors family 1 profile domain-containing protein n=1 Tax=Monopterus albus TaxID=43700 RepID=A0A3Q3IH30_MONAL
MSNISSIVVFSLSGFNATVNYRVTLFSLTLLTYCVILAVNVSLILIIILDKNLHEPMYICLCNLFINELYGTAGFFPKFAFDLLSDVHVISYVGCLLLIFVIYSYVNVDYFVLALVAYDRYVAIFGVTWLVPLCCELIVVTLASRLKLCGSHIEKIYCENWAVVKLACSSTKANNILDCFLFSYVRLVKSSLKSREGRRKFTQTCVPNLLCLLNVSAAVLFDLMYSRYGSAAVPQSVKNFMTIQFLLIPPILNPIIYGLILTKIRGRVKSLYLQCKK